MFKQNNIVQSQIMTILNQLNCFITELFQNKNNHAFMPTKKFPLQAIFLKKIYCRLETQLLIIALQKPSGFLAKKQFIIHKL